MVADQRIRPLGGDRLETRCWKKREHLEQPQVPLAVLLGKGLAATGTPLGMLALEPLYIGQQLAEGRFTW